MNRRRSFITTAASTMALSQSGALLAFEVVNAYRAGIGMQLLYGQARTSD